MKHSEKKLRKRWCEDKINRTQSRLTQLAGPMTLTWLANTTQGFMVGDYISTSIANGLARPVFAVANPNVGSVFDEAMYSPTAGLLIRGGNHSSKGDAVVASTTTTSQSAHRYL